MRKGLLPDTETQSDDVQLSPVQYMTQTSLMVGIIILFPAGFWTQTFGVWQIIRTLYYHVLNNYVHPGFEQVTKMIQSQYFKSVVGIIWSLSCAVDRQAALTQVPCTMSILTMVPI